MILDLNHVLKFLVLIPLDFMPVGDFTSHFLYLIPVSPREQNGKWTKQLELMELELTRANFFRRSCELGVILTYHKVD